MYYYIKRSGQKVIHRRGCYHLNNTEPSKTGYFGSIAEAEANGYRVCKHCTALKPLFKAENGDIEKICKEHAISVYNNWAFLDVDTVYGQWKIVYDERCKKLKLFHKNSYDTGNKGAIPGYHPQHCSSKTICGYLDYIIKHDDFRHYTPPYHTAG